MRFPGRRVRLAVFPVEIEPREFAATAAASGRTTLVERLRASLHDQKLVIGVDRLDPTKGLLQRLAGFRRLLERHEEWRRRTTLLQIAAISRKEVAPYRELRLALDREAGSINSDFGDPDWTPLRIVARGGARNVMAGYMREARVGLVTPLRDGMNLVAKEYVAAQDPADPGVLILSQFAGAARQLETALLINPHDPDDMAEALDAALRMPLAERQERWQEMWRAMSTRRPCFGDDRSLPRCFVQQSSPMSQCCRRSLGSGGVARAFPSCPPPIRAGRSCLAPGRSTESPCTVHHGQLGLNRCRRCRLPRPSRLARPAPPLLGRRKTRRVDNYYAFAMICR